MSQDYIIKEIKKRIKSIVSPGFSNVEIRQTALGNQAGLMGAAWLAERIIR